MANLIHFIKEDFTERTNTSASAVEVTQYTVNWSDLTGAGFADGDSVLVLVLMKLGCSSAANYARFQIGLGSTYAGLASIGDSYMSLECSVTAAVTGQQYMWIDQRTLVTNENIYFSLWGSATDTHRANDFMCLVFKIGGTDGLSSADFHYAEATHSGNAPASYDTAGASFSTTNAGDWLFLACSRWLIDSTTADLLMDIDVGGTALSEIDSEGEDLENEVCVGTIACATGLAASTTIRARYRADTVTTHDCVRTAIAGIRLNAFRSRWGSQTIGLVTHSVVDTFQSFVTNSSFAHASTGNVLAIALPIHSFTDAAKRPYGRITLGGSVWPASGNNRAAVEDNGAAAKTGPILHGYASVNAGTLDWGFDCAEDADVSPTYAAGIFTAAVFSLEFAPTDYAVTDSGAGSDIPSVERGVPTELVPMRLRPAVPAGYDSLVLPVFRRPPFARLPELLLPEPVASETQINVTDSSAVPAVDVVAATATLSASDSGAGSEVVSASVTFSITDTGLGGPEIVAAISASFSLSDSGAGVDDAVALVLVVATDSGSGADAPSAITVDLLLEEEPDAAIDSLSISASLPVVDAGVGADEITSLILISASDSGAGVDSASSVTADLLVADSGTDSEQITIYSTIGLRIHTQPRRAVAAGYDSLALPVFRKPPFARTAQYFVADLTEQTVSISDSAHAADWLGGPPVAWDDGGTIWDDGGTVWWDTSTVTADLPAIADSGAGVDTATKSLVSFSVADSGAGVDDVGSPFFELQIADVGLGQEVIFYTFNKFVTESGLGSETATVVNESAIHPIQRVPAYYPMWRAESFVLLKTPDYLPQLFWIPAQSFTVPDAGSGADTLVVTISALLIADAASGSEAVGSVVNTGAVVSDAAAGAEIVAVSGEGTVAVFDISQGSDQVVGAEVSFALGDDLGSGVDSIEVFVDISISDSGEGEDVITAQGESAVLVDDAGGGADSVSEVSAFAEVSDSGVGNELINNLSASLSAVLDGAVGVETLSAAIQLAVADLGSGVDVEPLVLFLIQALDSAVGVDSVLSPEAYALVPDSMSIADSMAAEALLDAILDNAVGSESVGRFDASVVIAKMRHRFSKRRMVITIST